MITNQPITDPIRPQSGAPGEATPSAGDETHKERVNRELSELLDEVRVAIPGAEVLFAFLLGVAFTERFESLTSSQRAVYFAVLLLTAMATALLISPTAHHRLRFRDGDKERMLFTASRLAAREPDVAAARCHRSRLPRRRRHLRLDDGRTRGGGICAWFVGFWLVLPLSSRLRRLDEAT